MTDERLLGLLRSDPEQGLREAVAHYGPMVWRVVRQRLPQAQREDLEEIVSDAFVQLYRTLDRLDPERGSLGAYLSVIARNAALRRARQLSSRPEIPAETLPEVPAPDHRELYDALMSLEEGDRRLITLRYHYGLTAREIGEQLGISEAAAQKRLSRALEKLRHITREEEV